jgi:hypothetical protein
MKHLIYPEYRQVRRLLREDILLRSKSEQYNSLSSLMRAQHDTNEAPDLYCCVKEAVLYCYLAKVYQQ